jgi:hypothetical protein
LRHLPQVQTGTKTYSRNIPRKRLIKII